MGAKSIDDVMLEEVVILDTSALISLSYEELQKLPRIFGEKRIIIPKAVIEEYMPYTGGKVGVKKLEFIWSLPNSGYKPDLLDQEEEIKDAFVKANEDNGRKRIGLGDLTCIATAQELIEMGYVTFIYTTDKPLKIWAEYLGLKCLN